MKPSRALKVNLAIAVLGTLPWIVIGLAIGHIGVNGGLGSDGREFANMVRDFTLKGGDKPTRLSPLFPALAWIPYALTGDVLESLTLVNLLSVAVLVFAACALADERGLGARSKVFLGFNLVCLIAFAKLAAFVPGRPELCAVAALTLAVASCAFAPWPVVAAAHVAAVMALPIGLAAPIYGVARAVRLRTPGGRLTLTYGPAFLAWVFVQWWARGGVAGALSDFSPRSLVHTLDVWSDPIFLAFVLYFFVTSAGGLSIIAVTEPAAWKRLARSTPESIILLAVLLLYAVLASFDAPLAFGFLAPVWILVCLEWMVMPRRWPDGKLLAAGVVLTLFTQRPLGAMDLTTYFVTWHPYDVYRGAVPIHYDALWDTWIPRFLVVSVAVWALSVLRIWSLSENERERSPTGPPQSAPPESRDSGTIATDDPVTRPSVTSIPDRPGLVSDPVTYPPDAHDMGRSDDGSIEARRYDEATTSGTDVAGRRWHLAAYGVATAFGLVTAMFLLRIPVQLSDSFTEFLGAADSSLQATVTGELQPRPYFRPLRRGLIKVIFDLSHGHYYWWFRGFHALQLVLLFLLVVRMLRVRSISDVATVPLVLAIVVGLHTFSDVVREAFPVNHFLTIALCCVGAVNLAQSRGGKLVDVMSIALLVFAMGTIESGLLVWVVFVSAYLVGYRGVSRGAVVAMTGAFVGYFILRFVVIGGTVPGVTERNTGFGLSAATPDELSRRFGANPWPFYAYNVVSAISSVLFAEPRGGTWIFTRGLLDRELMPWQILTVLTSTVTTALLVWHMVQRLPYWRRWDLDSGDRLVLLFIALLPANAAFAAVYQKDVILSAAGVFYAVAVGVAIRSVLFGDSRAQPPQIVSRPIVLVLVLLAVCGWTSRWVGIHYRLREAAMTARNDWAYYDSWEAKQQTVHIRTPAQKEVWQVLYDDAIWRRPAPPALNSRFLDAWTDPLD